LATADWNRNRNGCSAAHLHASEYGEYLSQKPGTWKQSGESQVKTWHVTHVSAAILHGVCSVAIGTYSWYTFTKGLILCCSSSTVAKVCFYLTIGAVLSPSSLQTTGRQPSIWFSLSASDLKAQTKSYCPLIQSIAFSLGYKGWIMCAVVCLPQFISPSSQGSGLGLATPIRLGAQPKAQYLSQWRRTAITFKAPRSMRGRFETCAKIYFSS